MINPGWRSRARLAAAHRNTPPGRPLPPISPEAPLRPPTALIESAQAAGQAGHLDHAAAGRTPHVRTAGRRQPVFALPAACLWVGTLAQGDRVDRPTAHPHPPGDPPLRQVPHLEKLLDLVDHLCGKHHPTPSPSSPGSSQKSPYSGSGSLSRSSGSKASRSSSSCNVGASSSHPSHGPLVSTPECDDSAGWLQLEGSLTLESPHFVVRELPRRKTATMGQLPR